MSLQKTKLIWGLVVGVVLIVGLSFPILNRTWFRDSNAAVSYNSKPMPAARIYHHRGDILVDVGSPVSAYIVHQANDSVGDSILSYPYWWIVTDFIAVAKTDPAYEIDMSSPKFGNLNPHLVRSSAAITFTDEHNIVVTVEINKPAYGQ